MSLKSSQSELNLSNGFKKRLLRPVSTHKQNDSKNSMKNSTLLSLHDHIAVKNKYGEAKAILQSIQDLLRENHNKSINNQNTPGNSSQRNLLFSENAHSQNQNIEKIIEKLSKKKHEKSVNQKKDVKNKALQSNSVKGVQTILKEISAQNLQQGLKILYSETQQTQQFHDQLLNLLAFFSNKYLRTIKLEKQWSVIKVNDNEQGSVLIAKLLGSLIKNFIENEKKSNNMKLSSPQSQTLHQPKFKSIDINNDNQKDKQIDTLKLQLEKHKKANINLENKLQAILSSQNQNQHISIKGIQNIHKQIQQIYDQSLLKKDELILKLKNQLLTTQQKLNKQFHALDQTSKKVSLGNYPNSGQDKQYTATVQQQFQKMRVGFAKKFQKVQQQSNEKQSNLKKQIFGYEKEIQNGQRQKNVLFKKYEFLVNNSQ